MSLARVDQNDLEYLRIRDFWEDYQPNMLFNEAYKVNRNLLSQTFHDLVDPTKFLAKIFNYRKDQLHIKGEPILWTTINLLCTYYFVTSDPYFKNEENIQLFNSECKLIYLYHVDFQREYFQICMKNSNDRNFPLLRLYLPEC